VHIDIVTLFPEMVTPFFTNSIMAKAVEKGIVSYTVTNFRDFAHDAHRTCDDIPYGGGAGMVIKCNPISEALDSIGAKGKRVVFPTPSGKLFRQKDAEVLSKEENLVFICGHYEGLDQRIIDEYVDDEFSIGDYVISSGEMSSLVIIDAVYRLIDGVIAAESLEDESFSTDLLEYPQYTRPERYCNNFVPRVLLSGNHKKIATWRDLRRIQKTMQNRPDLLSVASLDTERRKLLLEVIDYKGTDQNGHDQSN
jgi:tRNA (guanine-N1)-methyltransferase